MLKYHFWALARQCMNYKMFRILRRKGRCLNKWLRKITLRDGIDNNVSLNVSVMSYVWWYNISGLDYGICWSEIKTSDFRDTGYVMTPRRVQTLRLQENVPKNSGIREYPSLLNQFHDIDCSGFCLLFFGILKKCCQILFKFRNGGVL